MHRRGAGGRLVRGARPRALPLGLKCWIYTWTGWRASALSMLRRIYQIIFFSLDKWHKQSILIRISTNTITLLQLLLTDTCNKLISAELLFQLFFKILFTHHTGVYSQLRLCSRSKYSNANLSEDPAPFPSRSVHTISCTYCICFQVY